MKYLHTMVRVTDLPHSVAFFELLGLTETRRMESASGRFTLVFMAAPDDIDPDTGRGTSEIELTYNWPPEDGSEPEVYEGGRNFGHLAYRVTDIYALCEALAANGVTINRPPRDGHMAFVRSPDGISIELLQKGDAKPPREPWASMESVGSW